METNTEMMTLEELKELESAPRTKKQNFIDRFLCILPVIVWFLSVLIGAVLVLPYFPWVAQILNAMISDRGYLLDCVKNSLMLQLY